MCDCGLDGDMYDHSTDSGNWIMPGRIVDPIRSDPRFQIYVERYGEERALELITKNDTPSIKERALALFRAFRRM